MEYGIKVEVVENRVRLTVPTGVGTIHYMKAGNIVAAYNLPADQYDSVQMEFPMPAAATLTHICNFTPDERTMAVLNLMKIVFGERVKIEGNGIFSVTAAAEKVQHFIGAITALCEGV